MPTASVARLEKQAPLEATSSIKQGIVIVEHKIRNLEKRKARLESYKDLQKDGKELAKDQVAAISKFDEVVQTLEFARELYKQLNNVAIESAKNIKKQQRKEAQEKAQHELAMIKEALVIQDVLSSLGQESVREDFLQGKAGITLTAEELQQFDDLYGEMTPKHCDGTVFIEQFQSPAEHMMNLLEGKAKQAFGTTYAALKEKILAITKCGYFDQNVAPEPEIEQVEQQPAPPETNQLEIIEGEGEVIATKEEEEEPQVVVTETGQVLSCTFQSSVVQEDVRAPIDPSFYTSSHLSVFKSGPIDFMQDNELDTPDVDSTIPTLTYTNQSYTPVEPPPPQPEAAEVPVFQNETDEKDWNASGAGNVGGGSSSSGGGGGDAQNSTEWTDPQQQTDNSWTSMTEQQWQQTQPQNNDGFIPAGGRGGGRGGRGRGGGGGDRGNKGGSGGRGGRGGGPNQNNRGGYRDGNYRDNGYYQNGYRERGERGGRGGGGGSRGGNSSERPSGGRGGRGRGGYRGGGGGGGGGGGYRQ